MRKNRLSKLLGVLAAVALAFVMFATSALLSVFVLALFVGISLFAWWLPGWLVFDQLFEKPDSSQAVGTESVPRSVTLRVSCATKLRAWLAMEDSRELLAPKDYFSLPRGLPVVALAFGFVLAPLFLVSVRVVVAGKAAARLRGGIDVPRHVLRQLEYPPAVGRDAIAEQIRDGGELRPRENTASPVSGVPLPSVELFTATLLGDDDASLRTDDLYDGLRVTLLEAEKTADHVKELFRVQRVDPGEALEPLRRYINGRLRPVLSPFTTAERAAAPMAIINQITSHDAQLEGLHRQLERNWQDRPEFRALTTAWLGHAQSVMKPYFRILQLIWGPIQLITLTLYFFGIVLLRARQALLDHEIKDLQANTTVPQQMTRETMKEHSRVYLKVNKYSQFIRLEAISLWIAQLNESPPAKRPQRLALLRAIRPRLREESELVEKRLDRVEYTLLEYLLWGLPSLGFIGTVLGISQALGNANLVVLARDAVEQNQAITTVTGQLGVAFDTTLIALVCNIPLLYLITRIRGDESFTLYDVEQRICHQIVDPQSTPDGGQQ